MIWESGEPINNTGNVKFIRNKGQPMVVKKVKSQEDFERHISFYRKVICNGIKTPKILSIDRSNSMIKYQAIGIEYDGERVWSKTLVNFEYNLDNEAANINFLIRVIDYALKNQWGDLYSGNILFDDGYLYLIDYVPGRGNHKIGSFGLEKIKMNQRDNLKKEQFDRLLEMALDRFNKNEVSYCGLDFLRK